MSASDLAAEAAATRLIIHNQGISTMTKDEKKREKTCEYLASWAADMFGPAGSIKGLLEFLEEAGTYNPDTGKMEWTIDVDEVTTKLKDDWKKVVGDDVGNKYSYEIWIKDRRFYALRHRHPQKFQQVTQGKHVKSKARKMFAKLADADSNNLRDEYNKLKPSERKPKDLIARQATIDKLKLALGWTRGLTFDEEEKLSAWFKMGKSGKRAGKKDGSGEMMAAKEALEELASAMNEIYEPDEEITSDNLKTRGLKRFREWADEMIEEQIDQAYHPEEQEEESEEKEEEE